MLLRVDPNKCDAVRVHGVRLSSFGLKELDLQKIIHGSLDRLVGEDELLPIMRSRAWQEEPDILALDRVGRLFIFEVKVWEARSENLLQVLRYGQLFGGLDYDGLNNIWQKSRPDGAALAEAHAEAFGLAAPLATETFNKQQVFVVLTNGLDVTTRQAIQYWKSTGLDVRPWVYRVYNENGMLLELAPYRIADDPLEDQAEGAGDGYYVLNTNKKNDDQDERIMVAERRAAAFYDPWKFKIARPHRKDVVFLYSNGLGVIAVGRADGKLKKRAYHDYPDAQDEDYSMGLTEFHRVVPPLTAAEMKEISGNSGLVFRQTMFSLDPQAGMKLLVAVQGRRAPSEVTKSPTLG